MRRRCRRAQPIPDGTLFTLATVIGVFAVLAVWANRQALNTDNWTNTSTRLLADKKIQTAVAAYSVNELFKSGAVESQVQAVLPPSSRPLPGRSARGSSSSPARVAPSARFPQVQEAWRLANRVAHRNLLRIINGGGSLASTNGGVDTLTCTRSSTSSRNPWASRGRSRR